MHQASKLYWIGFSVLCAVLATAPQGCSGDTTTFGSGGAGAGASSTSSNTGTTSNTGANTGVDPCANAGGCRTNLCTIDCSESCCCGNTCPEGDARCGYDDELWRCDPVAECYEVVPCSAGCMHTGLEPPGNCVESMSCDEVTAAYDILVSQDSCSEPSDCAILDGHCSVGLGGCYHVVRGGWVTQDALDTLAEQWNGIGCSGPVCDCPLTPTAADCVAGHCIAI